MIKKLRISHLRNSEFVQFHQDITDILKKQSLTEPKLETAILNYEQEQKFISGVFNLSRKSEITHELQQLDQQRDNVFTGMSYMILANTYHYNEEVRDAASKLKEFINSYGKNIARLNYSAETSTLSNIINKCNSDDQLKNYIDKLSLKDWLNELEKLNNTFHDIYLSRVEDKADASDLRIAGLRKSVHDKYQIIEGIINALIILEGEEKYESLISRINIIVDDYNKRLLTRKNDTSVEEVLTSTDIQ